MNRGYKLSDVATIKFCTVSPSRAKEYDGITKWLVCANFLPDNVIEQNYTENNYYPDCEWLIKKDDIIIKRISPTFVNYIGDIPEDIYGGNNLIIITSKQNFYPKYLSMVLNNEISKLSSESSWGATMNSVSRQDLENLKIPNLNYEKQVALGELWYEGIELKKKKNRFNELESIKNTYTIKQYLKGYGGKYNG